MLVIILSNKSYFCFNYTKCFFHSCHEVFFSGTSNYFSNVYQELFFNWAVNYFSRYREFIFWSTMHCGLAVEVDWFEPLTSSGDQFENFASGGVLSKRMPRRNIVRERNERGFHLSYKICQELVVCRWWWGFLDRRFDRGDYEGTSRLVHNSNLYSTWPEIPTLPIWSGVSLFDVLPPALPIFIKFSRFIIKFWKLGKNC